LSERLSSADKVREFQRKLYLKAKAEPKFRFYALYDKTYHMDFLKEAYRRVKANSGKPGVDGETFGDVEKYGVEKYLEELRQELRERRYKPQPVLRVYIPKPNGEKRPLGIPTIRDRVVQQSFKLVLEPIFEADFTDRSYGFRPKRGAHGAIREIIKLLNWGCTEIYDVDIRHFFDTVEHSKLMKLVAQRVVERQILKLINQWLKCGYVEDGKCYGTRRGTPQGGVISPLLANIYLHPLDKAMVDSKLWWIQKGSVHIVRYADDMVILAQRNLGAGKRIVKRYLHRLGLGINEAKTRTLSVGESGSMDFLGFQFVRTVNRKKGNKFFLVKPSTKSVARLREKLRGCISIQRPLTIREQVWRANEVLRGWTQYYGLGNASDTFNGIRDFTNKRVRRVLQRRAGRAGYGYLRYDSAFIYGKLGLFYQYRVIPL
jgi:group II intron reverse transcriptase/maturase